MKLLIEAESGNAAGFETSGRVKDLRVAKVIPESSNTAHCLCGIGALSLIIKNRNEGTNRNYDEDKCATVIFTQVVTEFSKIPKLQRKRPFLSPFSNTRRLHYVSSNARQIRYQ